MRKWFVFAIVLAGLFITFFALSSTKRDTTYDGFALCLSEKNATFYGAYWCPHCQRQKNMFGDAKESLPYIECSLSGGKGQTQECKEAGIVSYPTWIFSDGSRQSGEIPLRQLSEKTGCLLP